MSAPSTRLVRTSHTHATRISSLQTCPRSRYPFLRPRQFSTTPSTPNYWNQTFYRSRLLKDTTGRYRRVLARKSGMIGRPVKSNATALIERQHSSDLPLDLGVLPGTVIARSIFSMLGRPSIFTHPRLVLAAQVRLTWQRTRGLFARLVYKMGNGTPWIKLNDGKIVSKAKEQYVNMYNALANGKVQELENVTCDNLGDECRTLINNRGGRPVYWELVRWVGRPRVLNNTATFLPMFEAVDKRQAAMRQALVHLQSVQRYADEQGNQQEKTVREYMVLQKTLINGKEGDWVIQGFPDQTRWEEFYPIIRGNNVQTMSR